METLDIVKKEIKKVKSSYVETTQVIGLYGFGTVGSGLYHVLENSPTTKARIKKVCIKNSFKERGAHR
jgi:homoserine dehydrogenase